LTLPLPLNPPNPPPSPTPLPVRIELDPPGPYLATPLYRLPLGATKLSDPLGGLLVPKLVFCPIGLLAGPPPSPRENVEAFTPPPRPEGGLYESEDELGVLCDLNPPPPPPPLLSDPNPGESFFDESVELLLFAIFDSEKDDDGIIPRLLETPPNVGLNPLGLYPDEEDDDETPAKVELYPEVNEEGAAAPPSVFRTPLVNLTSCSGAPPMR
jgi:hypothetical protein